MLSTTADFAGPGATLRSEGDPGPGMPSAPPAEVPDRGPSEMPTRPDPAQPRQPGEVPGYDPVSPIGDPVVAPGIVEPPAGPDLVPGIGA